MVLSLMGGAKGGVTSGLLLKLLFHSASDMNRASMFALLLSLFSLSLHMEEIGS